MSNAIAKSNLPDTPQLDTPQSETSGATEVVEGQVVKIAQNLDEVAQTIVTVVSQAQDAFGVSEENAPTTSELLRFTNLTLQAAYTKAAELIGKTPDMFEKILAQWSDKPDKPDEVLANEAFSNKLAPSELWSRSTCLEYNPKTNSVTFFVDFGKPARLKFGFKRIAARNDCPADEYRYVMDDKVCLFIEPEEGNQKAISAALHQGEGRKYTFSEIVEVLAALFKVDAHDIKAMSVRYMEVLDQVCKAAEVDAKFFFSVPSLREDGRFHIFGSYVDTNGTIDAGLFANLAYQDSIGGIELRIGAT